MQINTKTNEKLPSQSAIILLGMKLSVILFYIGYLAVVAGKRNGRRKNPRNSNDCFDPANLKSYIGKTAITVHGQTCQKWNANNPHRPKHQPSPGINHNFCRNPGTTI